VFVIQMTEWSYQMFLFFLAHLIAMSSTVYNPFVYAWFNNTFRAQFVKVVPCCRPARRLVTDDSAGRYTDVMPSPSRFATGGWPSSDTNHGVSLLDEGGGGRQMATSTEAPPIEMRELAAGREEPSDLI